MAKMTKMTVRKVTSKSTTKSPAPTMAQGLAAAEKVKEAARKLIGTKTPDGRIIKNIQEALKVQEIMRATKAGVVSGRLKRS